MSVRQIIFSSLVRLLVWLINKMVFFVLIQHQPWLNILQLWFLICLSYYVFNMTRFGLRYVKFANLNSRVRPSCWTIWNVLCLEVWNNLFRFCLPSFINVKFVHVFWTYDCLLLYRCVRGFEEVTVIWRIPCTSSAITTLPYKCIHF